MPLADARTLYDPMALRAREQPTALAVVDGDRA